MLLNFTHKLQDYVVDLLALKTREKTNERGTKGDPKIKEAATRFLVEAGSYFLSHNGHVFPLFLTQIRDKGANTKSYPIGKYIGCE